MEKSEYLALIVKHEQMCSCERAKFLEDKRMNLRRALLDAMNSEFLELSNNAGQYKLTRFMEILTKKTTPEMKAFFKFNNVMRHCPFPVLCNEYDTCNRLFCDCDTLQNGAPSRGQ